MDNNIITQVAAVIHDAVGVTQLQKSADAEQKRSEEDEKSEASDS